MRVNDSEMSVKMKQQSLVNTGDISPETKEERKSEIYGI